MCVWGGGGGGRGIIPLNKELKSSYALLKWLIIYAFPLCQRLPTLNLSKTTKEKMFSTFSALLQLETTFVTSCLFTRRGGPSALEGENFLAGEQILSFMSCFHRGAGAFMVDGCGGVASP